jgi:hypothetical protein
MAACVLRRGNGSAVPSGTQVTHLPRSPAQATHFGREIRRRHRPEHRKAPRS